jgi:hypothetical protein
MGAFINVFTFKTGDTKILDLGDCDFSITALGFFLSILTTFYLSNTLTGLGLVTSRMGAFFSK